MSYLFIMKFYNLFGKQAYTIIIKEMVGIYVNINVCKQDWKGKRKVRSMKMKMKMNNLMSF